MIYKYKLINHINEKETNKSKRVTGKIESDNF